MKNILVGIFLLGSVTLFAQDNRDDHERNNQVPDNVQHSFQRDNPNAQNPRWENKNGQWHSAYRDKDNRDVDAYYDGNGQRIDTHSHYDDNELPDRVRIVAHKRYHSNYKTYRIDRPNSQVLFQIRLDDGRNFYYDEHGKKRHYEDRH